MSADCRDIFPVVIGKSWRADGEFCLRLRRKPWSVQVRSSKGDNNMLHKCIYMTLICSALLVMSSSAQQSVFTHVNTRFPKSLAYADADRRMIVKDVDLVFDDGTRRLSTRGETNAVDISYDQITKVVFDVNTHMRGMSLASALTAGSIVGHKLATAQVNDYWCYIEYKATDGATHKYLMEIDKQHSAEVLSKLQSLFPNRVVVADVENYGELDKDMLPERKQKFKLDVQKDEHPLPEARPDKALVVVVCPAPNSHGAGSRLMKVRFHANGRVVAVNGWGGYSYLYLPPGEYLIGSELGIKARGGKARFEAGKEYYFFQDPQDAGLSRHSKELVMYEIEGSFHSLWQRSSPGEPATAAEMMK
jgi:hypothetical protein